MNFSHYDLVTVGGGLGASALAISMAKQGAHVLVLERETQFRDRVRGEVLAPWGVAEAKELGIAELLLRRCAKEVPWVEMGFGPRNVVETTPQKSPFFTFSHPEMQEALLAEAERAGAQVRRGVTVEGIEVSGENPVLVARNKSEERIVARFVVSADGRGSGVRKWARFTTQKNAQPFHFAGVLLTEVSGRDDLIPYLFSPDLGLVVAMVPLPKQRSRAYLGYPTADGLLVQGNEKLGTFMAESQKVAPNLGESYA